VGEGRSVRRIRYREGTRRGRSGDPEKKGRSKSFAQGDLIAKEKAKESVSSRRRKTTGGKDEDPTLSDQLSNGEKRKSSKGSIKDEG